MYEGVRGAKSTCQLSGEEFDETDIELGRGVGDESFEMSDKVGIGWW